MHTRNLLNGEFAICTVHRFSGYIQSIRLMHCFFNLKPERIVLCMGIQATVITSQGLWFNQGCGLWDRAHQQHHTTHTVNPYTCWPVGCGHDNRK